MARTQSRWRTTPSVPQYAQPPQAATMASHWTGVRSLPALATRLARRREARARRLLGCGTPASVETTRRRVGGSSPLLTGAVLAASSDLLDGVAGTQLDIGRARRCARDGGVAEHRRARDRARAVGVRRAGDGEAGANKGERGNCEGGEALDVLHRDSFGSRAFPSLEGPDHRA